MVVSAFEDWQLPIDPFDKFASLTSWHRSSLPHPKAASALRPSGPLVTITAFHILDGTVEFFTEVQNCYLHWDPSMFVGLRLPAADASSRNYGGTITMRYLYELRAARRRHVS